MQCSSGLGRLVLGPPRARLQIGSVSGEGVALAGEGLGLSNERLALAGDLVGCAVAGQAQADRSATKGGAGLRCQPVLKARLPAAVKPVLHLVAALGSRHPLTL